MTESGGDMPAHTEYFACVLVSFNSPAHDEAGEDAKVLKDELQKALNKLLKGSTFNARHEHTVADVEVSAVGVTLRAVADALRARPGGRP